MAHIQSYTRHNKENSEFLESQNSTWELTANNKKDAKRSNISICDVYNKQAIILHILV